MLHNMLLGEYVTGLNEINWENIDPDDEVIEDDDDDTTLDLPEPIVPLQIAIQHRRYVPYCGSDQSEGELGLRIKLS